MPRDPHLPEIVAIEHVDAPDAAADIARAFELISRAGGQADSRTGRTREPPVICDIPGEIGAA